MMPGFLDLSSLLADPIITEALIILGLWFSVWIHVVLHEYKRVHTYIRHIYIMCEPQMHI